ncbi:Uma2 family endonuclease [Rubrimonas sp.]|uniref:Uma2 family endonuclease n=1 Tax=Rubrimonas sp. TaxID=2036015 RepID=UPI002FDD66E0
MKPSGSTEAATFVSSGAFAAGAEFVSGAILPAPLGGPRHDRAVGRAAGVLERAILGGASRLTVLSGRTAAVAAGCDVLRPDIAIAPPPASHQPLIAPALVCEVLDRASCDLDLAVKVDAWRAAPSVDHAMWIDPDRGGLLHMRRRGARCVFRFYDDGVLDLDALGVVVDVHALAEASDASTSARTDERRPYTDLPLSGRRLPRFADVDDFLAWYEIVPGKQRFELVRGAVRFADMRDPAPEGRSPGLAVGLLRFRQKLLSMLQKACGPGLAALSGGLLVAIGSDCALCPDLVVVEGPIGNDDTSFVEPLIVVEILTAGSAARDATVKLDAYLGHRGIRWVLLVDPSERAVMVYRGSGDRQTPRLLTGGSLPLPPLRVPLDIAALLAND